MLFEAPRPLSKTSWASSESARRRMTANRRRDTKPELQVRRLLHAAGLRYRVDMQPLPALRRRADVVFRGQRLAVFIDGCYWHGCHLHGTLPATNREYWSSKVAANRRRDEDTNRQLADSGWRVARYWEHESPADVAADVIRIVAELRSWHLTMRGPPLGD
jgi:DNA mismatch endonuclease (patch repair protein)